ncbi:MAG: hypothetical protein A2008_11970 [Candidatus Wallbacteria bacterium GWC2_49_35]|uniref:Glycine zipper domain-containing protein n=1 Tax=Candidatus Wallbacteria bacterium GWC2_49_35 TaxID=1817813 RepID=A0A1F7WZE9_9BACT|nr:MAG: hypothetical protein A2008_11970 [Candidatus Wallbacteria bacterium GWC2_49_35]HBC76787.1 hypothetical protein [Candidatus Wallbacteria bacterium]
MKSAVINKYVSLVLILTFFLGTIFPLPLIAAETAGATESKSGLIGKLLNKIKPADNLSVGQRTSNMVRKIKDGEPILPNKNVPANVGDLSPMRASLLSGGSALKSAFSPGKIGMSAASTVGMKLFEQVKNGEKIDVGKAVGHLATGKFIGSFVGSGIGSAVGNMAGTLLATSIPVAGPILGAFMPALFSMTGGALAGQMGSDVDKGIMPSFKRAWAAIDKVDLAARAAGTTIGSVIGSLLLPGIGTAIGSFVGGFIASKLVSLIRKKTDPAGEGKTNNKVDNIRFGVDPNGPIVNIIPEADAALYLKYDAVDLKLGERAKELKDRIVACYRRYVQLLSNGFSYTSNECQSVFNEYKKSVNEYKTFRDANTDPAAATAR